MKFYCLHEGFYRGVQQRLDSFQNACSALGIAFVALDSLKIDYSELPVLGKTDLLYNATRGSESLENLLLNKDVTTFYIHNPELVANNVDTTKYSILHDKAKIPGPKTIYQLSNERTLLHRYVAALGGFPLILKSTGSTLGIGTIKVDNFQTLYSIADFMIAKGLAFILRQYIVPKEVARLIVLGNEVIAANQKLIPEGDFRTSVVDQLPIPKKYAPEIEQMAISATRLLNFEQAGVDILIDENEQPYLLEVNMPHSFVATQKATGIDIAFKMLEFLINKSKKNY